MKNVVQRRRPGRPVGGPLLIRVAALILALLVPLALHGCGGRRLAEHWGHRCRNGVGTSGVATSVPSTSAVVSNRKPAPDFAGTTVAVSCVPGRLRGKPLVLSFWRVGDRAASGVSLNSIGSSRANSSSTGPLIALDDSQPCGGCLG